MQLFQIQGLFAPFVATLVGTALLFLWHHNRAIGYLRFFAVAFYFFAIGFVLSQVVFEKMTVANAISSSMMYFAVSGLMVHGARSRVREDLNVPLHLGLMALDIAGRILILQLDISRGVYLIYANAMMGVPMALGAIALMRHPKRDIQSTTLAVAYAAIAAMAICAPAIILPFGQEVTAQNYFSSYYWMLLSFLTVFGICLLAVAFGFTIGSDLLRITEKNAAQDFLSGLLTRRAFDQEANELVTHDANSNVTTGVVMCDIDNFKSINDQHGHHAGDNVIKAFGQLFLKAMPEVSVVGRTGGEEFCMVVSAADIQSSRMFAEGLRTAISALIIEEIPEHKQVTASFGVTVTDASEPLTSAFKRADKALYNAKNDGRNRVVACGADQVENLGLSLAVAS